MPYRDNNYKKCYVALEGRAVTLHYEGTGRGGNPPGSLFAVQPLLNVSFVLSVISSYIAQICETTKQVFDGKILAKQGGRRLSRRCAHMIF